MSVFRFVPRPAGVHVRLAVFAAASPDTTPALLGELTMRPDEWRDLQTMLVRSAGGDQRPSGNIDVEVTAE